MSNPNNFGQKPQYKRSSGLFEARKTKIFEPPNEKTCVRGHRPGSKVLIHEAECLYYLCSEIRGADQLCDFHSADNAAGPLVSHT